ncbi:hypothetical protein BGZ73_000193 [Actinomortierella ambigua]|nr:hypothetical protein BGZ73_000193 [Actinomortierella ambigua]
MAGLTQNLSTAGMQLLTHIAHCVDNATEDVENLRQMVRDLFQDMKDLQERSRHRDAVLRNKLNEVRFSNDQVCKASLDAFHRLLSRVDDMCEAEERHRRWTDLTLASLESKIVQRLQSSMPLGSASPRQGMWHKPQARHSLKHEAYTHDDGDHAEAEDTSNGADGVYTNGQVSPTQRHLSKRCRRQDSLSNSHPEAIEVRSSQSSGSSPEQHKDDHVGNDVTTATTTTDSTNTLLIAVHGCGQAHEDAIAPESCQGTSPLFAKEKKDEEAEDGDDEEEDDEDDEDYVDGDHEEEKVDTSKAPKPTKRSSRRQSLRLKNSFK